MLCVFRIVVIAAMVSVLCTETIGAPGSVIGDYNDDGVVNHADYSVLGDNYGQPSLQNRDPANTGTVGAGDLTSYVTRYGDTSSTPSILPFTIVSTPTSGGNVEWAFIFANVNGSLAGQLGIQIDGPSAPNILSVTPGANMQGGGVGVPGGGVGVPGSNNFGFSFLTPLDDYGNPSGKYLDNTTHQAYGAFGTTLSSSGGFVDPALTFLTLVTEGLQTTTLRVIGGDGKSEYGYGGQQYYFTEDQVATFNGTSPAVPEAASILIWALIVATAAIKCHRIRQ